MTKFLDVNNPQTVIFDAKDKNTASKAAKIIRNGGLVAIPTETVYGLSANALLPAAVKKIFEAKGRPDDNPLIIHIADVTELCDYCANIPDSAYMLAEKFWPGPLTLVLERKGIPDIVTAGLNTVAVRCPESEITRTLIKKAGVPLAAPSANISGRPSPTNVKHVLDDLGGKIDAVIDGGICGCGIESTIIDLTKTPPVLLRPGSVTLFELQEILGKIAIDVAVFRTATENEKPAAPGMKYRHYAPETRMVLLRGDSAAAAAYVKNQSGRTAVMCFTEEKNLFPGIKAVAYGKSGDWRELSRNLFGALRQMDLLKADIIYVRTPDETDDNLALINRLKKAAGYEIIEVKGL